MADREKKDQEIKKFEYLANKKSFLLLDEIKNIFHNFWRAIIYQMIWWKIKIW